MNIELVDQVCERIVSMIDDETEDMADEDVAAILAKIGADIDDRLEEIEGALDDDGE
jgi:hypothetical protein